MSRLKKLIKEALTIPSKKNCDCGGACCSTEITAPILKENKFIYTSISDELKYHIDNKIPLNENIYRMGSKAYMELFKEARSLYSRNRLDVSKEDKYILTETNIGNFGITEGNYDAYDEIAQSEFSMDYDQLGPNEQEWVRDEYDSQPSGRYLNEEATDEELKREYANILSKEAHLTRVYMNNRTDENWERLSLFRQKGRGLEKKLAKMGLIDSYLAEINEQIADNDENKIMEGKNSNVNFVKRLLQSLQMGMGTKPLSDYQISVIIDALFKHKIIQ